MGPKRVRHLQEARCPDRYGYKTPCRNEYRNLRPVMFILKLLKFSKLAKIKTCVIHTAAILWLPPTLIILIVLGQSVL